MSTDGTTHLQFPRTRRKSSSGSSSGGDPEASIAQPPSFQRSCLSAAIAPVIAVAGLRRAGGHTFRRSPRREHSQPFASEGAARRLFGLDKSGLVKSGLDKSDDETTPSGESAENSIVDRLSPKRTWKLGNVSLVGETPDAENTNIGDQRSSSRSAAVDQPTALPASSSERSNFNPANPCSFSAQSIDQLGTISETQQSSSDTGLPTLCGLPRLDGLPLLDREPVTFKEAAKMGDKMRFPSTCRSTWSSFSFRQRAPVVPPLKLGRLNEVLEVSETPESRRHTSPLRLDLSALPSNDEWVDEAVSTERCCAAVEMWLEESLSLRVMNRAKQPPKFFQSEPQQKEKLQSISSEATSDLTAISSPVVAPYTRATIRKASHRPMARLGLAEPDAHSASNEFPKSLRTGNFGGGETATSSSSGVQTWSVQRPAMDTKSVTSVEETSSCSEKIAAAGEVLYACDEDPETGRSKPIRITVYPIEFMRKHHIMMTYILLGALCLFTSLSVGYDFYSIVLDSTSPLQMAQPSRNDLLHTTVLSTETTQLSITVTPDPNSPADNTIHIPPSVWVSYYSIKETESFSKLLLQFFVQIVESTFKRVVRHLKSRPGQAFVQVFGLLFCLANLLSFVRHFHCIFDESIPVEEGAEEVCAYIARRLCRTVLICCDFWHLVLRWIAGLFHKMKDNGREKTEALRRTWQMLFAGRTGVKLSLDYLLSLRERAGTDSTFQSSRQISQL